jgi:hypothetical protein
MQLMPPYSALTDGVVTLRVPVHGDGHLIAGYAWRQGDLDGFWLPSLEPCASPARCRRVVEDWLTGEAYENLRYTFRETEIPN